MSPRLGIVMLSLLGPPSLLAQAVSVTVPPGAVLPNYDRIPMGEDEGIEGGAFLARTGDAAANWYNPAGLAKSVSTSLNASATAYEWTTFTIEGLNEKAGRSRINTIGTLLSVVVGNGVLRSRSWRIGFSLARPILWRPSSADFAARLSGGQELFTYSTDVDFEVMVPAVAVAFAPGGVATGRFRFGLGLGLAMTSLLQNQTLSDRLTTAPDATITARTFSADGSAWALRPSAGLQWEVTRALALGAQVVTPTLRIRGDSRVGSQSARFTPGTYQDLIFQDSSVRFDYRLPLAGQVGAAVHAGRGAVEVDVRYFSKIAEYDLYSSERPGLLTVDDATGSPVVTTPPFAAAKNSARSLFNLAAGGAWQISSVFKLHAGFNTDQSPIDDQNRSLFRRVNLSRFAAGFSLRGSNLSGSVGLAYAFGSGERESLGTTTSGQPIATTFTVRTINLLFALSYSFSQP